MYYLVIKAKLDCSYSKAQRSAQISPLLEHSYGMRVAAGDIELRWSFFYSAVYCFGVKAKHIEQLLESGRYSAPLKFSIAQHSYGMRVAAGDIELRWSFFWFWGVLLRHLSKTYWTSTTIQLKCSAFSTEKMGSY